MPTTTPPAPPAPASRPIPQAPADEEWKDGAPAPHTPPARPRVHLDSVDGLRALAALYVVCVHSLPRAWIGSTPDSLPLRLMAKVLSQGAFAVSTFIVVSGFCLMLPAVRAGLHLGAGGLRTYLARRFWRIAPPLYIAFALTALLYPLAPSVGADGAPVAFSQEFHPLRVASHLALVHHVAPGGLLPSNAVFWSVGVEWWIYFLFPPLLLLWRRWGGAAATAAALAGSYALLAGLGHVPLVANSRPHFVGLFALGACAAAACFSSEPAWSRWRERVPWGAVAAACYAAVAVVCAVLGWARAERYVYYLDLLIGVGTSALLLLCARPVPEGARPPMARRLLGWRPLAFVGTFSYSLYLIHYPLQSAFVEQVARRLSLGQTATFALLVFVALPGVVALAYLFYLGCERPFHHLARRVGASASAGAKA